MKRTYEIEVRESGSNFRAVLLVDATTLASAADRAQRALRQGRFADLTKPRIVCVRELLAERL